MLGDSIVISDSEDIRNFQRLKDQFSVLFNDSELFKLQNELKGIKCETKFIQNLHIAQDSGLISVCKTKKDSYPQLYRLVQAFQMIPYSNSRVKRIFFKACYHQNSSKKSVTVQ